MLTANLTIGSETYNLTGNDLKKSLRARTGDAEGVDQILTVSHDVAKVNGRLNDRHLVRLDLSKIDATAVQHDCSAYLVINQPRSTEITDAEIIAMCVALATFITASTNANLIQVLNGEI
jgi:hypothetical protein